MDFFEGDERGRGELFGAQRQEEIWEGDGRFAVVPDPFWTLSRPRAAARCRRTPRDDLDMPRAAGARGRRCMRGDGCVRRGSRLLFADEIVLSHDHSIGWLCSPLGPRLDRTPREYQRQCPK
jgi:hypothetical protein